MEIKIIYQGELNEELDKDIEKLIKKYGYEPVGSGYNFKTKERDIKALK